MLRIEFIDRAAAQADRELPLSTPAEHSVSADFDIARDLAQDLAENPQIWPILDYEVLA